MNELTAKQIYVMIFFIPLVYKMASLPALLYGETSATSYILIGIIVAIEFIQLAAVLLIANKGGMEGIKEKYGAKVYCLLSIPILFVIFIKTILFTKEIVIYVCRFLFYNIDEVSILMIVLVVVFYLGVKGVRAVGRLFEIAVWLIPLIIIFGVFFGELQLESGYLTPLFEDGFSTYSSTVGKFLIYTFDFSPLLYAKIKVKKARNIVVCSILSTLTVIFCYALLYSAYGNASVLASYGFARLGTFHTVVSEIGSLDWPSSILWLMVAVLSLSFKINAVDRIMKEFKIPKIGTALFLIGASIVLILKIETIADAIQLVTGGIQYAVFACEIVVPLIVLILYAIKENTNKENKIYATQN